MEVRCLRKKRVQERKTIDETTVPYATTPNLNKLDVRQVPLCGRIVASLQYFTLLVYLNSNVVLSSY